MVKLHLLYDLSNSCHESLSLNSLDVYNQTSFDCSLALGSVCGRLAFLQGLFWSFVLLDNSVQNAIYLFHFHRS